MQTYRLMKFVTIDGEIDEGSAVDVDTLYMDGYHVYDKLDGATFKITLAPDGSLVVTCEDTLPKIFDLAKIQEMAESAAKESDMLYTDPDGVFDDGFVWENGNPPVHWLKLDLIPEADPPLV